MNNSALRVQLTPEEILFPIIEDLISRGMTDYLVFPLNSATEVDVAISLATRAPDGFNQDFLDALDTFRPPLACQ